MVDQKDIKVKKMDADLTKMRGKYEKILSKMYMTGQDEIIEGLAPNILERGEVNTLMKGNHQQNFQMSNTLQKYNNDISELVNENGMDGMPNEHEGFRTNASSKGGLALLGSNSKNNELSNKKWAEELTKADDRASNFQHQYLIENKKRREVEDRMETLEKQITIREEEIKRLHNLYEGG